MGEGDEKERSFGRSGGEREGMALGGYKEKKASP